MPSGAMPLEKGMKSLQYSCLENPMNSMKRQKNTTLKDELSGSVNAQRRVENNTRKNEETETKQNTTQLWM